MAQTRLWWLISSTKAAVQKLLLSFPLQSSAFQPQTHVLYTMLGHSFVGPLPITQTPRLKKLNTVLSSIHWLSFSKDHPSDKHKGGIDSRIFHTKFFIIKMHRTANSKSSTKTPRLNTEEKKSRLDIGFGVS